MTEVGIVHFPKTVYKLPNGGSFCQFGTERRAGNALNPIEGFEVISAMDYEFLIPLLLPPSHSILWLSLIECSSPGFSIVRKALIFLHRYTGLAITVFLIIVALTG